jgi:hypothetical protein
MNSTYLSQEQRKRIPDDVLLRCPNQAAAEEYARRDPDLVVIRFLEHGELVHACVLGVHLLKATGRTEVHR